MLTITTERPPKTADAKLQADIMEHLAYAVSMEGFSTAKFCFEDFEADGNVINMKLLDGRRYRLRLEEVQCSIPT